MIRALTNEVQLARVLREAIAVISQQPRLEEAVMKHFQKLPDQLGAHEHFGRFLLEAMQHLVLEVFEVDQLTGVAAVSHYFVYNLILKAVKLYKVFVQSLDGLLLICVGVGGERVLAEEDEAQDGQCALDVPRMDIIDVVPRERHIGLLEVRNHVQEKIVLDLRQLTLE